MKLKITGFQYINSSTKLVQGVKGNRVPRGAIAGGNGSFIVPVHANVLVDLLDTETGRTTTVDMYGDFKSALYQYGLGNLTATRAAKIIAYYQSIQPFDAPYWDTWPGVDLRQIL